MSTLRLIMKKSRNFILNNNYSKILLINFLKLIEMYLECYNYKVMLKGYHDMVKQNLIIIHLTI